MLIYVIFIIVLNECPHQFSMQLLCVKGMVEIRDTCNLGYVYLRLNHYFKIFIKKTLSSKSACTKNDEIVLKKVVCKH